MPALNLGTKSCMYCNKDITLKIRRDVERKKFCSKKCHGLYTVEFKLPKDNMQKLWPLTNLPEHKWKKAHHGENHPNYKHDRSQVKSKRSRYENTVWTKQIFERDDYTCQHCGIRGGKLQADHIQPYSTHPELRWELSNGRTLCVPCHKKTDTYGIKLVHMLRKAG